MKLNTNELLYALSKALDHVERDVIGVTSNHSKRVAYISMRLCATIGMDCDKIYDMAACATLHDNALTEYTNSSKGELSLEDIVKMHCSSGEVNAKGFPFLGDVKNIILHHHENWDGTGCFKLKKEETSLRASILRFADNLDLYFALGTDAESKLEDITAHVSQFSEVIYSPVVTEAFFSTIDSNFFNCLKNENVNSSLIMCSPNIHQDLHYDKLAEIGRVFASIIDAKSKFTLRHTKGISQKAGIMARYYNFDEEHRCKFVLAADLHDIGKLSIPNTILDKPGGLNKAEFEIIKGHVVETESILSEVKDFKDICAWACGHHEKLDGTGYHQAFKNKEIAFETRLLACIDIFQALTEDRPYREGMPLDKTFAILDDLVRSKKIDEHIIEDMKTVFTNDELVKKYS